MKCPQPTDDIRGPRIADQSICSTRVGPARALTHVNKRSICRHEEDCSYDLRLHSNAQLQRTIILKWTEAFDSAISQTYTERLAPPHYWRCGLRLQSALS
jgi:hypothetical protein